MDLTINKFKIPTRKGMKIVYIGKFKTQGIIFNRTKKVKGTSRLQVFMAYQLLFS